MALLQPNMELLDFFILYHGSTKIKKQFGLLSLNIVWEIFGSPSMLGYFQ